MKKFSKNMLYDSPLLFERGWRFWEYKPINGKFLFLCTVEDFPCLPFGLKMYSFIWKEKSTYIIGRDYFVPDAILGLTIYGIFVDPWFPKKYKEKTDDLKMSDRMKEIAYKNT